MLCDICKLETGAHYALHGEGVIHVPSGIGCEIACAAVAGITRDGFMPLTEKLEEIRKAIRLLA